MKNHLTKEMDQLILQLKQLNTQFAKALEDDKPFAESKQIYLRIKEANAKLKRYFESGVIADLLEKKEE